MRYNVDWFIVDLKARNVNSRDASSFIDVEDLTEMSSEIQKRIDDYNTDFRRVQKVHVTNDGGDLVAEADVKWTHLDTEKKDIYSIRWILPSKTR